MPSLMNMSAWQLKVKADITLSPLSMKSDQIVEVVPSTTIQLLGFLSHPFTTQERPMFPSPILCMEVDECHVKCCQCLSDTGLTVLAGRNMAGRDLAVRLGFRV